MYWYLEIKGEEKMTMQLGQNLTSELFLADNFPFLDRKTLVEHKCPKVEAQPVKLAQLKDALATGAVVLYGCFRRPGEKSTYAPITSSVTLVSYTQTLGWHLVGKQIYAVPVEILNKK